jgi:2-polyprenyl-3-methyl-5-hydroxy-6-metoxy-1,4-benzoquinol methylase
MLRKFLAVLMRNFFALLYHQFAWTYDFVAAVVSLGMWKQWVSSTLPYLDGPRVLEIGHGPGHLLLALAEKGLKATGLDESRWMGKIALKKIRCQQQHIINGLRSARLLCAFRSWRHFHRIHLEARLAGNSAS